LLVVAEEEDEEEDDAVVAPVVDVLGRVRYGFGESLLVVARSLSAIVGIVVLRRLR
jgi:hypothetical protein